MRNHGAYSVPDFMEVVGKSFGQHKDVGFDRKSSVLMEHVLDFRRLLRYGRGAGEDRLHHFKGLGTELEAKR